MKQIKPATRSGHLHANSVNDTRSSVLRIWKYSHHRIIPVLITPIRTKAKRGK